MLNLCITADHEMFFSENYLSEEEVFIDPTYKLMELLETNNINMTLFTDVCSIWRYKELQMNEYPRLMEEQLRYAIRHGHDVQLHLHPHWITSEYNGNKWVFDTNKYRLHEAGFEAEDAQGYTADDIVRDGKEYLDNLLYPINSNYKCIAFRAGGWCLQPEKQLMRVLAEAGLCIDTTVFEGGFIAKCTHYLNYKKVPHKTNWWINPERGLNCDADSDRGKCIFEIAIGSYTKKPYLWKLKIKNKILCEYNEPQRGKGLLSESGNIVKRFIDRASLFIHSPIMLSFDTYSNEVLIDIIEYYLKEFDCRHNDYYISIICHPKFLGNAHFDIIEKFIKNIQSSYSIVRFTTMQQVLKDIKLDKFI